MSDDKVIPAGSLPPEPQDKVETTLPEPIEQGPKGKPEEKQSPDWQQSYKELQKQFSRHSNEVGELRGQNKMLMEQVERLQQAKPQAKAEKEAPAVDYEKMLRDISSKYESGDITFEDAMLQSNNITRQMTTEEVKAQTSQILDQATNQFQATLADRDNQAILKDFHRDHPDYREKQESGKLAAAMQANPMHDEFSAYWELRAMEAEERAAAAKEEGKAEAARIAAGSDPASRVLSKPGQSIQQQNKSKKPMSRDERRASMLAALDRT